MNNPFDYTPSERMLQAQQKLIAHINMLCEESAAFAEEVKKGKMFGILLASPPTPLPRGEGSDMWEGAVFAFSGQIGGRYDWPQFVPAVFDYLDEQGYFKTHEREIDAINKKVAELEQSAELMALRQKKEQLQKESDADIEAYKRLMQVAKAERDVIRLKGVTNEADLIRESQFMKAELHRKKTYWKEQMSGIDKEIDGLIGEIRKLKLSRQHKSDHLQRWLFEQFVFTMPDGQHRSLTEIFQSYLARTGSSLLRRGIDISATIPSGAGECCEPKLLHYAYSHGLQPEEIGMFWWGESPKQEVREHLQFYPACNGKCRPILEAMMPNLQSATDDYAAGNATLPIVYEDDALIIVNKPAGMLSVPGKGNTPSVLSILKAMRPECTSLHSVHRLDMDTSGLLIVAKSEEVHKALQKQFATHSFRKEYIAVLDGVPVGSREGDIALPLRPNYADRPRQVVDLLEGKEALTHYIINVEGDKCIAHLFPMTGRTHQLRIHCAHHDGLGCPIKGDRLYGKRSDRLYLHAFKMEFQHPATDKTVVFEAPLGWE